MAAMSARKPKSGRPTLVPVRPSLKGLVAVVLARVEIPSADILSTISPEPHPITSTTRGFRPATTATVPTATVKRTTTGAGTTPRPKPSSSALRTVEPVN